MFPLGDVELPYIDRVQTENFAIRRFLEEPFNDYLHNEEPITETRDVRKLDMQDYPGPDIQDDS